MDINISVNGTTQPIKKVVVEFYESGEVITTPTPLFSTKNSSSEVVNYSSSTESSKPRGDNRLETYTSSNQIVEDEEDFKEIEIPDTSNRDSSVSTTMNEEF